MQTTHIEKNGKQVEVLLVEDEKGNMVPSNQEVARVGTATLEKLLALRTEYNDDRRWLREDMRYLFPLGLLWVAAIAAVIFTWDSKSALAYVLMILALIVPGVTLAYMSIVIDDREYVRKAHIYQRQRSLLKQHGINHMSVRFEDEEPGVQVLLIA